MDRFFIIVFLIFSIHLLSAQNIEFKDKNLLQLQYVNPEACDYPYNIAFFYSFEEFQHLKFNGIVNEKQLKAHRSWYEDEHGDSVLYQETIIVDFGESSDFRQIKAAFYVQHKYYEYDEESNGNVVHKVGIDYQKKILDYHYQKDIGSPLMNIKITDFEYTSEEISFLQNLCQFYQYNNQDKVQFSIQNNEE